MHFPVYAKTLVGRTNKNGRIVETRQELSVHFKSTMPVGLTIVVNQSVGLTSP
jgi:hypothetical protein